MAKLSELKKKYQEELERRKEQEQVLNGTHQEIEVLVIDMGYSQGGLANLYAIMDAYVTNVNEKVKEVEEIIKQGKVARIKAKRLVGTKRLTEIIEVKEEDDPDVEEDKVWQGEVEWLPPRLRFIRVDGEIFWIDMGSLSYERIANLTPGTYPLLLVPALVYTKRTADGVREFHRIRGFYYVLLNTVSEDGEPEEVVV